MKQKKLPAYYLPPALHVIHFAIFALVMAGFFVRSNASFWAGLPLVGSWEIGSHYSNFALSYAILAGASLPGILMDRRPLRRFAILAGLLATANIIYELCIPVLNTRDPLDALYGLVGTALAFGMLLLYTKCRLPTPSTRLGSA